MWQQLLRNARAVVLHVELQRQRHSRFAAGKLQAHARPKCARKMDLSVFGGFADCLCGIFDEIKKDLNELIAIAEYRGQRWIIVLYELDMARKAGTREPFHMLEHGMNVDWLTIDRALVRENLHPVHELHDAIGFLADEPGKAAIIVS